MTTSMPSDQTRAFADFAFGSQTHVADASRPLAWLSPEELNIDLSDPVQRRFGDYELIERIGQGGMGVVYRARQHGLERDVAIKLLAAGPWASEEFVARFRREAKSAARMQHPNIVEIYEFGHRDGLNYFSMRLIDGLSLAQRLAKDGPMPAKDAAKLLRTLGEAMDYAHRLGVLHLDLKPANVLIGQNGEPLIADFGLARRIDAGHDGGNDEISGTPSYMAPEQALLESHPLTASTDIYGLGTILYEALTGRPPFQAASAQATLERVIAETPAAPRKLRTDVPPDLEAICLKCLEKEPGQRYASARQLADDLGRFVDGHMVSVRQLTTFQRLGRWMRREPRLAGAVGIAILSLMIGAFATVLEWRRAEQSLANAEYLGMATFLPSARNLAIHALILQIHDKLDERPRREKALELSKSKDSRDWLLAGLIGETLSTPEDYLSLGDAQLRRAVSAMPTDRLGLMAAINYCGAKWIPEPEMAGHFTEAITCPVPDAASRLSRLDPDNLFAWLALIDPPNFDLSQTGHLLWQYDRDPSVHARLRALVAQAARANRWDAGHGRLMQAKAEAFGVGYLPLHRHNVYSGDTWQMSTDNWEETTASAENVSGSLQETYYNALEVNGTYSVAGGVLAKLCNPKFQDPGDTAFRADCTHIFQVLADSHDAAFVNYYGWQMLRRLGKGTPVEAEMIARIRRLAWMREQDTLSRVRDPVQSGLDYVHDVAKYGELEAQFRQLDRLGIPRDPPLGWQPRDPNALRSWQDYLGY